MSTTRDLTDKELIESFPEVLAFLLTAFSRHANALSDYLTPDEVDKWLVHIQYATRNQLLVNERWSVEHADKLAKAFCTTLRFRIFEPAFFLAKGFQSNANKSSPGRAPELKG